MCCCFSLFAVFDYGLFFVVLQSLYLMEDLFRQKSTYILLVLLLALNSATFADETPVTVISNGRAIFVREPKNVLASIGDTVELSCLAFAESGKRLDPRWVHFDILTDFQSKSNGSLIITNVNAHHEGTYRCGVLILLPQFYGILLSTGANVTLKQSPRITVEPQDLEVHVGGVARFECAADAVPEVVRFFWYRNNLPVIDDSRLRVLRSGIIQIVNVVESDQGIYRCVAVNDAGNSTSRSASLKVTSKKPLLPSDSTLKIVQAPKNVSVPIGSTALLECLVWAESSPEIVWRRLGSALMPPTARKIGSNLEISNVEMSFEGAYECVGKSDDKEIRVKANLTVDYAPKIKEFPQEQLRRTGETARFSCVAVGHPSPEIVWYRNGDPVVLQGRIKTFPRANSPPELVIRSTGEVQYKRDLVVSSIRQDDSGVYQCFVTNYLGQVSAAALLGYNNDGPIEINSALVARSSQSDKSIDLAWDVVPSDGDSKITTYIVHFYSNLAEERENTFPIEANEYCAGGKCRVTCCGSTSLKPYTNYTFWLSAVSETGRMTMPSNETTVTSWQEVSAAPMPLMVQEINVKGAARLLWDALPSTSLRGEIVEYRLEYMEGEGNEVSYVLISNTVHEHLLTNLKINSVYWVRVIPKTRAGFPNASALKEFVWLKFKVDDRVGEQRPMAPMLKIDSLNSSAVKILVRFVDVQSWQNEFRVIVNRFVDDAPIANFSTTRSMVSIGFLEPSTLYQIFVYSISNGALDGLTSSRVFVTSKRESSGDEKYAPLIPYPKDIACQLDASRHILVSWIQPPPFASSKFTVRYSLTAVGDEALNASTVKYRETTAPSAVFVDFKSGQSYLIAVKTETSVGVSKYSDDIVCDVPTTVPTAPRGVSSVVLNNSSVLLTWVPGGETEDVDVYRIQCRTNDEGVVRNHEVNGTITQMVLSDLKPSEIYFITVTAVNQVGDGPSSSALPVVIPLTSTTTKIVVVERTSYTEGIVIGICIAVICVFVVLVYRVRRNNNRGERWSWLICTRRRDAASTVVGPKGGTNGHLPNGMSMRETEKVETGTLLLPMPPLIENACSDSKGGNDVPVLRYVNGFGPSVGNGVLYHNQQQPLLMKTNPLTVTVDLAQNHIDNTLDQCSDLSHSGGATGSSLHSWAVHCNGGGEGSGGGASTSSSCNNNRRSHHFVASSMPNLTDSGIGFDDLYSGPYSKPPTIANHHFIKNSSPPPPPLTNGLCHLREILLRHHPRPAERGSSSADATTIQLLPMNNQGLTLSQGTC